MRPWKTVCRARGKSLAAALAALLLLASPAAGQWSLELDFPAHRSFPLRASPAGELPEDRGRALESSPRGSAEDWWLSGGHTAAVLDAKSLMVHACFELPDTVLSSAASAGERRVVVAGTHQLESGMVGLYDLDSQRFIWKHEDLLHPVTALAIQEDRIFIGDDAGVISAVDLLSGESLWKQSLHSRMVTSLVGVSAELMASGDWGGKIILSDPASGRELGNFQQHRGGITQLAVAEGSPLPRLVSTSRDGTVRLWFPTQRRLVRFVQLEQPLTALAVLSTTQVVVAGRDATLHIVDLELARVVATVSTALEYVTTLARMDQRSVLAMDGRGRIERVELTLPTDGEP